MTSHLSIIFIALKLVVWSGASTGVFLCTIQVTGALNEGVTCKEHLLFLMSPNIIWIVS